MRTGYPHESGVDRKIKTFIRLRKEQFQKVKEKNDVAKIEMKKHYDKGKKERRLKVGEWVLIENFYKSKWIEQKRIGPFRVEKVMENNNYLIYDHLKNNWKKYNIQHLVKYKFNEIDKKTESDEKEESSKLPIIYEEIKSEKEEMKESDEEIIEIDKLNNNEEVRVEKVDEERVEKRRGNRERKRTNWIMDEEFKYY
jgi:hypothetical protein